MNCKECGKKIKFKRSWKNLFEPVYYQVCYQCFTKNKNDENYLIIPIENSLLFWYPLLIKIPSEVNLYYNYLGYHIIKFIKESKNDRTLIILDHLDIETFKIIEQLNIGQIQILTIYIKGEHKYEI